MELNLFEVAAKTALRVTVGTRRLSVEDLYSLPLLVFPNRRKSAEENLQLRAEMLSENPESILDLERVAQTLNKGIREKEGSETSFVGIQAKNPELDALKLGLAIVKRIIEVRMSEAEAEKTAKDKAEKVSNLKRLIADKQREGVAALSLEELNQRLMELQGA